MPVFRVAIAYFCPVNFGHRGLCFSWDCVCTGNVLWNESRVNLISCLTFKRHLHPVQLSVNCCTVLVETVPWDLVQM